MHLDDLDRFSIEYHYLDFSDLKILQKELIKVSKAATSQLFIMI